MTNAAQHTNYLRLTKLAEHKADERKAQIKTRIERDIMIKVDAQPGFWRGRNVPDEIEFLTSKACSADPEWKKHVAMNQWYMQQAIMYGTAANNDLLRELLEAIRDRG